MTKAKKSKFPTGVYLDAQGRYWFCIYCDDHMSCSSTGRYYVAMSHQAFKGAGWKLTKGQVYHETKTGPAHC